MPDGRRLARLLAPPDVAVDAPQLAWRRSTYLRHRSLRPDRRRDFERGDDEAVRKRDLRRMIRHLERELETAQTAIATQGREIDALRVAAALRPDHQEQITPPSLRATFGMQTATSAPFHPACGGYHWGPTCSVTISS